MRSAGIITAAFAASAVAIPWVPKNLKRALVTDVDIVYVTEVVTVTAGYEAPAAEPTSAEHYGHHRSHHRHSSKRPSSSAAAPTQPTTYAPPPPSSTEEAPAPPPSSYKPPPPPPTSEAPAPEPTSEAPPPPPASPKPSPSSPPKADSYSEKVVVHHNLHRANHSSPDVEWDDALAATAQKIGESCRYEHDTEMDGGGYGQNIAAGVPADNITAVISDLFYNGEVNAFEGLYGQDQPDMTNFHVWGHFSQIVWKGTTKVACATVDCSAQGLANVGSNVPAYFTVCNYKDPGNYANEYADNVLPPKGLDTCTWDAAL